MDDYTTEIERRIGEWYDESEKEGFRYCNGCSFHIHESDLRDNNGYCPGCEDIDEAQENVRGAL